MTRPPSWAIDTNVIVSGLLSPSGCPGRLIDMLLDRRLYLTFDDRIEEEYRDVLARPRLNIPPERREAFLAILTFQDRIITGPWAHAPSPDPDDQPFLETALQATDRVLVTGNARHFPKRCRGPIFLLTPRTAWDRLTGADR